MSAIDTTKGAKLPKTPKRLTEEMLLAKGHSHIVPGTLRWNPEQSKQVVTINTFGLDGKPDGNTREVATSDLHQCRMTAETKRAYDRIKLSEKAKAKRAEVRALLAAAKAEGAIAPDTRTADVENLVNA
jgi:hypothetical protein